MNKKLSNKDKKDWEKFVNSKEAIQDKDLQSTKKDFSYIEKIIDLHGYSLEEANINYKGNVSGINYSSMNGSQWIKLKKFVFLKDIKYMQEIKDTSMYTYNHVNQINKELLRLVDDNNNIGNNSNDNTVSIHM